MKTSPRSPSKAAPKKSSKAKRILLGRGVLNWPSSERRSDRYGLISLSPKSGGYLGANDIEPESEASEYSAIESGKYAEQKGTMLATVLETRQSGHIGDFFRGIFPVTPKVGDEIELGSGTLFYQSTEYGDGGVGVKPDDGRDSDWMNPRNLYRCHDQTVALWFLPA